MLKILVSGRGGSGKSTLITLYGSLVLDIKPYSADIDSHPTARIRWREENP